MDRLDLKFHTLYQPIPFAMAPAAWPATEIAELSDLSGAVQVEFGHRAACALFADGTARCRIADDADDKAAATLPFTTALTTTHVDRIVSVSGSRFCGLLTNGGTHCRRNEKGFGAIEAPMHRGSTTPIEVFRAE